jgi:hypothetical protein
MYITYKNVVLNLDYVDFSYVNPLLVILFLNFRKQVGTAILNAKGKVPYGDLMMINSEDYASLYPHLSFNVYGNLYATILSPSTNMNHKIKCLDDQLAR